MDLFEREETGASKEGIGPSIVPPSVAPVGRAASFSSTEKTSEDIGQATIILWGSRFAAASELVVTVASALGLTEGACLPMPCPVSQCRVPQCRPMPFCDSKRVVLAY